MAFLLGAVLAEAVTPAQTAGPGSTLIGPEALKSMSVEQLLEQPILTVSRRPEAWREVASNVYLIRGDAEQVTRASRLPELLRLAPHLFVAQANAHDWAVNSRGFTRWDTRSNKMLVLVDGRTVYSPLFSGVFWDTQIVFLPDLDWIEAISGPAGVSWGSNAVNGVINVRTKSAAETQGGLFYGGLGNELRHELGVRYGGRLGEGGHYRVYAKTLSYDATLDPSPDSGASDEWDFVQAGFRADWERASGDRFTLQGDAYHGDYALAGDVGTNQGANLNARWRREFGERGDLSVRAYYDYGERGLPYQLEESLHTADIELEHSLRMGRHRLLWGAGYRIYDETVESSPVAAIYPASDRFGLFSVFAQDQIALADERLQLSAGVRLERNAFSGWESQPQLRLAWLPNARNTVWTSFSRATRTPSRVDRQLHLPRDPPYSLEGGPDFDSETLHAAELGWRGQIADAAALTVTGFYHHYDDLRSIEVGTSPAFIGNGVEGRSYGLEVFFDWDVVSWWDIRAGGFLIQQSTSIESGHTDIYQGQAQDSHPAHQVQWRNVFRLGPTVTFWNSLRHVAAVPVFEAGQRREVPAYTELDATLNWRLTENYELSLVGRNLLAAAHPEIGRPNSWREIQRSLEVKVRCHF